MGMRLSTAFASSISAKLHEVAALSRNLPQYIDRETWYARLTKKRMWYKHNYALKDSKESNISVYNECYLSFFESCKGT